MNHIEVSLQYCICVDCTELVKFEGVYVVCAIVLIFDLLSLIWYANI